MPGHFTKEAYYSNGKNDHRENIMMMFPVPMKKRVGSDGKCDENHQIFKRNVVNDVNTEYRQALKHHRKDRAVNSASKR
jgi:hypothetical protein